MKNYLKISGLMILMFAFFSSCEEREYIYHEVGVEDFTYVNVDGTISTEMKAIEEGNIVKFTASIPQAYTSDATIRVQLNGDDYEKDYKDFVIVAGESSVSGEILLSDDGLESFTPSSHTLSMTGLTLDEGTVGTKYKLVSNEVSLDTYDKLPQADENDIVVLLDWENAPSNDLDIFLLYNGVPTGDSAATGSRYETLVIDENMADGTYTFSVDFYATPLEIMGYKWFVTSKNDFSDLGIFSGTYDVNNLSAYTLDSSDRPIVFSVVKTTDANTGEVSFTASHF